MSPAKFVDAPLRILNPAFDAPLTDTVMELEHLRRLRLNGSTPPYIFFQMRDIFHLLESLESARIEGNHTTIAEYIDTKIDKTEDKKENIWELENIQKAMTFIESEISQGSPVTRSLIREIHKMTVEGLKREGDPTPGLYRRANVSIGGSGHLPPDFIHVESYMEELLNFINAADPPKYDLMKIAIAHHRFTWIHLFRNGNGRVVRLLTYTMLIKFGFNVRPGARILNPTAVFCNDREKYYEMLSQADKGTDEGLEAWCTYMLSGVKHELNKVDQLLDYTYLVQKILNPALDFAEEKNIISNTEKKILKLAVDKKKIKAGDLSSILTTNTPRQRAYQLKKLVDAKLLRPLSSGSRTYILNFSETSLIRGVMRSLSNEGFASSLD